MSNYVKQGFYSGQPLKASQLEAMEDGIINAEKLAQEAASQGAQADYNENDSAAASYIKNRPFYEEAAFDPIEWDGIIGDRESVDISHLMEAETGTVFMVKLSDNDKLMTEDYIGSTITVITSGEEQILEVTENDVIPAEQANALGMYGQIQSIVTVFDISLTNSSLGVNLQSSGTYGFYSEVLSHRVKSLSKTTIKKIDEKFLPELADASNMEEGTGVEATQQVPRSAKTNKVNAQGQLCFEGDSPYISAEENVEVPFGALAEASVSLGGRTSAQATHSMATNSKTIAKGEESLATGYATIAAGGASFSGGSQTIARAEASTALGHKNDAAAPYTFVHGVQNVAGGLYQAVFGVANKNNVDNLFEIGNGKLDEQGNVVERVNALSVTRDGRVKVQNLNIEDMEVNDLVPMAVLTQGIETIEANRNIQNGAADGSIQQKYGTANAVGAAAFGTHTQANAEASISCGAHTIAGQYAQTVVGQYNNKASRVGSLFVVGGGASDTNRKNALEVISDGEIIIYWNDAYYSLNLMLNLISNAHGGPSFFDAAKK